MSNPNTDKLLEATNPAKILKPSSSDGEQPMKVFTIRGIDPKLHMSWKTCAALAGISMEEFGLQAVREYVKKALRAQLSGVNIENNEK